MIIQEVLLLDTDDTTADTNTGLEARHQLTITNQDVNVIIPLNRYSFFEELEDKMLVPMQLQFTLTLNNDDELIYKAGAAANGRFVVDRFLLWVPKMIPKDSLFDKFVSTWTYLKEMYNFSSTPRQTSVFFQISASIDNVQHVFVYLQREKTDNSTDAFQVHAIVLYKETVVINKIGNELIIA